MFRRILIANRGEIAVRVIRACHEMDIEAVAVYSDVDAGALHVQLADRAYRIGPAPALESYLNIPALIDAARATGADAVHPGYGFLAENAEFARAVQDAGLTWIGPPPGVIALLGDKVAAKRLAEEAGLPIVPGYQGGEQTVMRFATEAERIGYPVLLKAAAGGGGKGMRIVRAAGDLEPAFEGARREARSAFGDDRLFIERYLGAPRHIEIQVMADRYGRAIHLGERECSVQRRHQKIVEEAPSPIMTAELRDAMGEAALRLVRASGYQSAGTVEFLFAGDSFYFLEMNTRIQVEHPVTEMVTDVDMVRLQIELAAGQQLVLSQLDVQLRGHAIEARIYAEDPNAGFLPATGRLTLFEPPEGPGVRNDVGTFSGADVTQYYDPLLAKLIVHGRDRTEAVARLRDALTRYASLGVTSNLSFLQWLVANPEFVSGRISTSYVSQRWEVVEPSVPPEVLVLAAGFDVTGPEDGNPWKAQGGWRVAGARRVLAYAVDGVEYDVALQARDGTWKIEAGGDVYDVSFVRPAVDIVVARRGQEVWTGRGGRVADGLALEWRGVPYRVQRPTRLHETGGRAGRGAAGLSAPIPGTVVKVAVRPGQAVAAHEPLVVLEAMKMEHVIEAPHAGTVTDVLFREGDLVPAGAAVVQLEEA